MVNLLKAVAGAAVLLCMTAVAQAQTTPPPSGRYASVGVVGVTKAWKDDSTNRTARAKDEHIVIFLDTATGQLFFCGDDSKYCELSKAVPK